MSKNFSTDESKEDYLEFMKGAVAAFAPGRIEFLGNHLDYNGGIVLGTAINAGIYGLALPMEGTDFRLFSESFEGAEISGSMQKLEKQTGKQSWANYCLGVLRVLQDRGLAPHHGFSLTLSTDLPMSAGLSSSAAVELATAQCLLQLANQEVSKKELVNICRLAENEWVGLPCGILDQGTSAFGESNQVVRIDCAKEEYSTLPLPAKTSFWIFDTGIKHDLVDSHYGTRNQECMDALNILQNTDASIKNLAECPIALLEKTEMANNLIKTYPHGLDVEVFNFKSLKKSFFESSKTFEREHVTQYIRHNDKKFTILNHAYFQNHSDIRITIDTKEDLKLVRIIVKILGIYPSHQSIIKLFKNEKSLKDINKLSSKFHMMYNKRQNII